MKAFSSSPRAGRGAFAARALAALIMAFLFSLIIFTSNTPLGPAVGSDNAMYLTMGTALARGAAPYSDIFDHKGPLLFVLQMIPQLFTGGYSTLAVFIQEVVFLWASLMVLMRMARRLRVSEPLVLLLYLALLAPVADGGNLTEEYANLFTLIGLDEMLAVFGGESDWDNGKGLLAPAAVMGAMTALCFMLRANNMLPLACGVFTLALYLLLGRRYASLGCCALGFAAGCAVVFVPVLAWLAAHGALADAFYGAIIHNMMYADTGDNSRIAALLLSVYGHYAILLALIACLGAAASFLRTRRLPLSLAMIAGAAGGGLAGFISHKYYNHYLMLSVPMAVLGAAQLLALLREKRPRALRIVTLSAFALCAAALAGSGVHANTLRTADYAAMQALTPDAKALYAQVPEEDRDSFLAYRVEPKWYVAAGALPCMRFYFLQEILADADPAVMDEIVSEFESDPPHYVVLFYNRPFSPPYDERVQQIFDTRYDFVDAKGEYQLLRLKENP